jgi:hypothetical protein
VPRLAATGSTQTTAIFTIAMGRKTRLNYPYGARELFTYDTAGRL